ncbi:hypothetical protein O181_119175 [Austropuccinia psidii MF-1]|uniref:Uncharacterized protein n=1 Tax=Austropuccinia psidii MF-1 TaxID=1389203 RepID=A0A9Q3KHR6_9BASI|nr:hypothetical protein [Austropuccinia psidii MF-1]
MGQHCPWGTLITTMERGVWPTDCITCKRAKKVPNPNMMKNGHSDGQDPKTLKMVQSGPKPFSGQVSRTMGTRPLLGFWQSSIRMSRTQEDQLASQ